MHNTNDDDDILITYCPDSLQEDNYIADIEAIIENGTYHSDEVSETDDEKTQNEVSRQLFYMFIFIILLMVSLLYS